MSSSKETSKVLHRQGNEVVETHERLKPIGDFTWSMKVIIKVEIEGVDINKPS